MEEMQAATSRPSKRKSSSSDHVRRHQHRRVFLILCIFYMIGRKRLATSHHQEHRRSAEGVAAVFLASAGRSAGRCLLGRCSGSFVEHINDVQDWLARINPGLAGVEPGDLLVRQDTGRVEVVRSNMD